MEAILGAATVGGQVRQRPDSVEHLDHEPGQPWVMISGNACS